MIANIHEHILDEIKTNTKTDTIFILTSILLNFIALAINSVVATEDEPSDIIIFILFMILIVVVNAVAIKGLQRGKLSRSKLLTGLLKMYKDEGVDKYYDPSILEAYDARYNLFTIAVVSTGIIAIAVPFVIMTMM